MTPRILVVDDDPFAVELFWRDLPSDQFEIVTAADGAEAFDLLSEGHFDVLVADVLMPVVDGVRLVRLVRDTPAIKDIAIVVITSSISEETRAKCLEAGADEFVVKPFRTSDIPQLLHRVIAKRGQAAATV